MWILKKPYDKKGLSVILKPKKVKMSVITIIVNKYVKIVKEHKL
jgi:hypothetical protein